MPVLLKTMQIHKFWRRLTTTRHARTLEAKLALERAVVTRLDAVIAQQDVEIDQQRIPKSTASALKIAHCSIPSSASPAFRL